MASWKDDPVVAKKPWETDEEASGPISEDAERQLARDMPMIPETIRGKYGFTDEAREQGAFMGFGDELFATQMAGFNTLSRLLKGNAPDWNADYERELQMRRAQREQWQKKHPVAKYTAPIIGGAGSIGGVASKAAQAPTLLRQMGQGATAGATYGAVAGFGAGEGGLENRAQSAGQGATAGAIIGGAAPAVVAGARGAVAAGKSYLGMTPPEDVAASHIARAVERSGRSQDEIATAVNEAQALGVPAVPADTSESLRRLGRAVETVPGRASEAVTRFVGERQTGQGERVMSQIKRAVGGGDFARTADEIIKTRAQEAAPLYQKAYEASPANMNASQVWDKDLESLLKRPAMRQAYARARTIAANEGVDPNTLSVIGYKIKAGEFGSYGVDKGPILAETPTMRSWDYIKRGLDDVIERYRDKTTGKLMLDEAGRAIVKLKAEFVSKLDGINPTYAQARKVFAGHSEMLDALNLGRDFHKWDREVIGKRFGALSEAEQDMFRIGAVRELRKMIEASPDGADVVRRIFGTPDRRERLRMLFKDPDEFEVFSRIMELERETTRTARKVTGGSPTGRIEAEQDDLMVGAIEDAVRGAGPYAMARNFATHIISRARGLNEDTARAIASYLFNPNPATRAAIDPAIIQAAMQKNARIQNATRTATRGLGVGAGVMSGQQ